jgi:hypothetical protein
MGSVVEVHRLWIGGVVAAVIVSGLAIVGFLVVCGMLNYPLLSIRGGDAVGQASMFGYAGVLRWRHCWPLPPCTFC